MNARNACYAFHEFSRVFKSYTFSLALATLGTSRSSKRLLYVSIKTLSTIISLVGNVQLALPGHVYSPFAWLEGTAPPLVVLATSFILKEQLLGTIELRHANEQVFQTALAIGKLRPPIQKSIRTGSNTMRTRCVMPYGRPTVAARKR